MVNKVTCRMKPGKGKPGPSNALDLPVIAYLKRERSRPCPFCQRWMDYHVLIDHMQYCCVQEVGEDAIGSSSAKDPLSFESPPKTAQKDGVRQCILCKRWMDSNYLVNHMRDFHVVEVKEAVEKAKAEKRKRAAQPAIETYATFMKKKRRFVEPEEGDIDMRCPICELNYPSQEDLVTHCRIYHGERYALVHRRTFKSAADYKQWKDAVARTYRTVWIKCGKYRKYNEDVIFYRCSRVFDNESREEGEDEDGKKSEPVYNCTSFLKEFVQPESDAPDGPVRVQYCTRHIGHDLNIADLPLSKSDVKVIEGFLKQGLSADVITWTVQNEYGTATRLHWVTESDIEKIAAKLDKDHDEDDFSFLDEDEDDDSPETSYKDDSPEPHFDHDYTYTSVSATELLEEGEEDHADGTNSKDSADSNAYESAETPIRGESLLGCSSCAKLYEKMIELEALVGRLNERLVELEGPDMSSVLKKERT